MYGKFRCTCGRYMRYHHSNLPISTLSGPTGGSHHYVCGGCGAQGRLWIELGDDEMIQDGEIVMPTGEEIPVGWDEGAWEWRAKKLIRA
jgi:hypothetical protein